jgi:hypothetical protein
MEKSMNNQINFLEVTIKKEQNSMIFDIYWKPTSTDIIIPQTRATP